MKRIFFLICAFWGLCLHAQQTTFIYFEDKNGLRDSLEIALGLSDDEIDALPFLTPTEAEQAFKDSTCWVLLKAFPWDERKYVHTYAYKPYEGLIESARRDFYIPVDRLPVTIRWDKQFFIDNNLPHSVMSDMGAWFDVGGGVLPQEFLAVSDSCILPEIDNGLRFENSVDLLVKNVGIALGAPNNPVEGLVDIPMDTLPTKLLHNGHIYIRRGYYTYSLTGQAVR